MKITLAGGSIGGAWSTMGTAIGETIRLEAPGSSFTYEPGVDAANVQLVANGKVELGITHAQMALRGMKGAEPFKAKVTDIKAIALLDPQAAVQILVLKDSKIQSLAQIKKDKLAVRLAFNKRGTMMAVVGEEVFKAAGISVADIAQWGGRIDYVDYNTGLAQLKNGQTDLVLNMLAFPSAQVNALARDVPLRLIGLDKPVIDTLSADVGTKPVTVPAGTYPFEIERGEHGDRHGRAGRLRQDVGRGSRRNRQRHGRALRLSGEGLSAVCPHGRQGAARRGAADAASGRGRGLQGGGVVEVING